MDHQRFELRFHDNCLNLFTPGRQPNAGYVRAGGERHHRDHVVLQRHVGHLSKPESPNRSRRPSTLSVLPREPGATALPSSNLHEHASREIDHRLHNAQGDSLQQPPPRLCAPQCRRNGAPSDPSRALPKKGAKKDSSVLCEGILTDYLGTVDRRPHAESWGGPDVLHPSICMKSRRPYGNQITTTGTSTLLAFIWLAVDECQVRM